VRQLKNIQLSHTMLFVCDYILLAALGRCFSAQEVQKTSSIFRLEAPAGRSLIMHFCKKSSSIISASRSSYSQVSSLESVPTYSAIPTKLVYMFFARAAQTVQILVPKGIRSGEEVGRSGGGEKRKRRCFRFAVR